MGGGADVFIIGRRECQGITHLADRWTMPGLRVGYCSAGTDCLPKGRTDRNAPTVCCGV